MLMTNTTANATRSHCTVVNWRLPPGDVPKEILVPVEPDDLELYEEFLSLNRGSKVRIRVPKRGSKRELLATATLNAR